MTTQQIETTQLIDPADWARYFDDFSRAHVGETAVMREIALDLGDQEQATPRQFLGISSDVKGSEPGSICIMLGAESGDNIEHIVAKPSRVYVYEGQAISGTTSVQIEQGEGPKLVLQLRRLPALSAQA